MDKLTARSLLNDNADELNKALAGNFAQASVTLRRWDDTVKDESLSAEVTTNHGVSAEDTAKAGKFIKNLMVHHPLYKEMQRAMSAVRTTFYTHTIKLGKNLYAVAIPDMPDVIKALTVAKNEANVSIDKFLDAYPQLIGESLAKLGTMATNFEYPDVDELRNRIGIEVSFTPLPDMRSFGHMNLPPSVAATFAAQVGNQQRDMVTNAMTALYDDLTDTVTTIATYMSNKADGEKGFKLYDSRIEQIKRLSRQLQAADGIVSTDFSDLSSAVSQLAAVDYEAAKKTTGGALEVAKLADTIVNKLATVGIGEVTVSRIEDVDDTTDDIAEKHILPPEPAPVEEVKTNPYEDARAILDAVDDVLGEEDEDEPAEVNMSAQSNMKAEPDPFAELESLFY